MIASNMRFPVLVCKRDTLLVVRRDFFERTGRLDDVAGILDQGIDNNGSARLNWILDSTGKLFGLRSQGVMPRSVLQWFGLLRRRERFGIEAAKSVNVTEMNSLIAGLHDYRPEIPNVTDLARLLSALPPDTVLDQTILRSYFGE